MLATEALLLTILKINFTLRLCVIIALTICLKVSELIKNVCVHTVGTVKNNLEELYNRIEQDKNTLPLNQDDINEMVCKIIKEIRNRKI